MINAEPLHFTFSPRFHLPHSTRKPLCYTKLSPSLTFLKRYSLSISPHLKLHKNPNSKVIRTTSSHLGGVKIDEFSEGENSDLPVELNYTRSLPPALTLEHGFLKIKEAVEKLKSNPPSSASGIVRFQVPVPPSAKAFSWLCSQPRSLEVFPQFYLSKENPKKSTLDPHSLGVPGVSGVGAAVYLMGSLSYLRGQNLMKRYLSVDSPLIRAYGFVGIKFDTDSCSIKHESDSFYVCIPHIELGDYEGITLLAATLAWNGSSFCSLDGAFHSLELSLNQAMFGSSGEVYDNKCIYNILGKSNVMEDDDVQMVSAPAGSFDGKHCGAFHLQLEEASVSSQFCFRLSSSIALTRNMLDHPSEVSHVLQHSANINAVWASLIIEECVRHGLKYFCIAPGSRSSPLAVAASSHPYTLCVSCFDERSLAFHALGYARGSSRPAVVITSSGTAVSNLLPAVVEASQDFVPILLLTADRPPELQDAGANQAINQVNHFGSFVRYFFNLPPPTDHVPARMVLTTVDSAIYCATHDPCGPVHINCQFREPLEDTPRDWMPSCLNGLDFWMSSTEPFSKYIRMQHPHSTNSIDDRLDEVLKLIQCASKGLLVLGAIHTEHEMWAALLLAKHLSWPTVADILSGLRLRTVFTTFPEIKENFLFLDHLDHALLSDAVREWAQADVIVQVGSRITSKRIGQMLEMCSPCTYIMVDKHPYRHDPSHIVTHRIQSTITEFASSVLQLQFPRISSKWSRYLQAINMMVAWEIEFQVHSEQSLTEPYVARVVSEALPSNAALFIGNSMVIRDADMYGRGWLDSQTHDASIISSWEMEFLGLRVTGNRGASGIDGLLSTAIGFSAGCNKQVFCVIGDISFLHDTNALAILKQRSWRKPMTILVINNHGGAIFSLLPIAERTQTSILNQYFYTSHNISIGKLCEAHSINHLQVRTKLELKRALSISQEADADLIIEVESCIEDNANFHSILRQASLRVADHTLSILSRVLVPDHKSSDLLFCTIQKVEYSLYRIQLSAPPTSTPRSVVSSNFYRQGFVLTMYLEDGTVGYGEVAPLEMHAEYLEEVEEQLRFVAHVIQGTKLSYVLPLLRGSFCSWISGYLGIPPQSLFPSVRCGIEMAVLNALAARQRCTLANLLIHRACTTNHTELLEENEIVNGSSVQVCALLDSNGTPREVADVAVKLAEEGFTTIKLKVGRRESPSEDAAVIQEIRKRVGPKIRLRADANRNWTFEQASQFGRSVKFCDLQYIEEPVDIEDDIIRFCEETGLPVALDETIDNIQGDPLFRLEKFVHPGIVAVVIKPSVVGGFENAALIGNWAHKQDKMAVVSAAFESSLSLSTYIQFSYYLNQQNVDLCKLKNKELKEPVAHGLGTYRWLKEDVTTESLRVCAQPYKEIAESSPEDAARLLQNLKIDQNVIQRSYTGQQVWEYQLRVDYRDLSYSIKVLEAGPRIDNDVLVFLHGFLGTGQDWIPVMKALSASMRCISVDLPGHGETLVQRHGNQELRHEPSMSLETISNVLCKLISTITSSRIVLVGYSMGARIALYMALRCHDQIDGAVIISGSPGLNDIKARQSRMVLDDARAHSLTVNGLPFFLDRWYSGDLWISLRARPDFEQIISSRVQHNNVHGLAKALADLSIGRQPSLWEDLKQCEKPLLFLFGEKDKKFKAIGQQIRSELNQSGCEDDRRKIHKVMEVPDSGHAIHLENPLLVISAVRKFLRGLKETKT